MNKITQWQQRIWEPRDWRMQEWLSLEGVLAVCSPQRTEVKGLPFLRGELTLCWEFCSLGVVGPLNSMTAESSNVNCDLVMETIMGKPWYFFFFWKTWAPLTVGTCNNHLSRKMHLCVPYWASLQGLKGSPFRILAEQARGRLETSLYPQQSATS